MIHVPNVRATVDWYKDIGFTVTNSFDVRQSFLRRNQQVPWVCEVTGGPFKFSATKAGKTHLGLEEAHRGLKISPEEFDEVAAELGRSLDFAKVPAREKGEVLAVPVPPSRVALRRGKQGVPPRQHL